MRVVVRFTGMFRHYTGERERAYELPEGARVDDLLARVGRDYASRLPLQVWDPNAERFHPLIRATRRGAPIPDQGEGLREGDEIYLISRMAGG